MVEISNATVFLILALASGLFLLSEARTNSYLLTEFEGVEITEGQRLQVRDQWDVATEEFLFCLYGRIEENTLIIDRLELADVILQDEDSVEGKCPLDFFSSNPLIGGVHNHPSGICAPGHQDLVSFGEDAVIGIVCSRNLLVFYTHNNLVEGFPINLISV